MIDVIKFIIFILYSTSIFFLPNNKLILLSILINILIIIYKNIQIKNVLIRTCKVLPFVIFTFIFNCILDEFIISIFIAIKLIIVCNITIIYSETTSINQVSDTIKLLFTPLKLFKINPNDIKIMVCISLSMIPILKKEIHEIKEACIAKNINFNIKNMKIILTKFFFSIITRVNKIEEALIAKGYNDE